MTYEFSGSVAAQTGAQQPTKSEAKASAKGPRTGRPPLGARLYLRKEKEGTKTWIIRDRGKDLRTGCMEDDIVGATAALEAYMGNRPIPSRQDVIPGTVYFVTCVNSTHYLIKIGWTKNLSTRMQAMQGGNPNILTVLATVPGTYRDERRLHRVFSKLHVRGEWFRRGDDLMKYVSARPTFKEVWGDEDFAHPPSPSRPSVNGER